MREILFRGKSCIGNWVYGYLKKQMVGDKADVWAIQTEGKEMLHLPATRFKPAKDTLLYENIVDPNTVGQYTGLKDKNGKMIFDGDILMTEYGPGELKWHDIGLTGWLIEFKDKRLLLQSGKDYEVIGNIHDNPELLDGVQILKDI